jgi:hypothetical protein
MNAGYINAVMENLKDAFTVKPDWVETVFGQGSLE